MPEPTNDAGFAQYLVIDFEATCCNRGTVPRNEMEIIEFGAAMVDAMVDASDFPATDFRIVDEFQSFVRPVRHPALTGFCTQLTSIVQADVDTAPSFPECIAAFEAWLSRYRDFAFCSWGDYDQAQLQQDCDFHRIANPISAPHRNLKRLFSERQQRTKKYGLSGAIREAGLRFTGTHHRGIDDARNIARLLPFVFGDARLAGNAAERTA
jgi:inhibitor of KinA sporulation pathway (predicted exonuclease)